MADPLFQFPPRMISSPWVSCQSVGSRLGPALVLALMLGSGWGGLPWGIARTALAQEALPLDANPEQLPSMVDPEAPDPLGSPPGASPPASRPLPTSLPELRDRLPGPEQPDFEDYRLGPGDGIFVGVQRFPDLSFQATLDLQGIIVMPLAGAVNLQGLTLEEARRTIFDRYNQYVVNPDVSVTLTAQRPVQVTLVGEVARPGFYPLSAPQLSVALLTAGGTTMQADLRQVHIQRDLGQNVPLAETIDLFTPLAQGEAIPNVRLQDGDVVRVDRLDPSRLDEYDRNLVANSTLAQPEITVRVLNYASGTRGIEARFGALSLRNGSRFLDALAQAGVNPDLAAYNRIAVLRFNPEKGAADTIVIDAAAAVNGDLSQNIPLQENDVIVVDRNLLARVTYALNTFTQPFRDVLGFLLFFESIADAADSLFGP
jgi:polysaccharide export outer membrane protein